MRFKGGSGEGGSAVSVELKVTKRVKNGPLRPATRATDDLHEDSSGHWHGRKPGGGGQDREQGRGIHGVRAGNSLKECGSEETGGCGRQRPSRVSSSSLFVCMF